MIKNKINEMVRDPLCKENIVRPINRKVCKNNCKFWNGKKCLRGYNNA